MQRRRFLAVAGSALATSVAAPALIRLTRKSPPLIAGGFVDDAGVAGHRLRERPGQSGPPACGGGCPQRGRPRSPESAVGVVIIGAGIAGLSAAWELDRRGMRDFVVLELDRQAGGNARSGENDISSYPWAAHYVPVPGTRATLVRELFEELGVLQNGVWDERQLCFSPQERLYLHGEWRPGIEPDFALDRRGRDDFRRFDERIAELRHSGEFTIPMERGVRRDSPLDRISMREWLTAQRLSSPELLWYVDYACRDDYGALASETSAWAGVHYFASRQHDELGPLTWPEGNGWIVKRLLTKLGAYVSTNAPALRVERIHPSMKWRVLTPDSVYVADTVIFAAPSFVASYVVEGMESRRSHFVYSPWLTANLTLERWPEERGRLRSEPAWDNVIYDSPALGYVVATHQSLRSWAPRPERTVWTFYWSLAELSPSDARLMLRAKSWAYWRDRILDDLERAHPDIRDCVSRIDVMRHGHAMIRPTVGFLTDPERRENWTPRGIELANSDRSGLSLFEEAQYQGVSAARRALRTLSS